MAIVPVFRKGQDTELQTWREPLDEDFGFLDSFFGRGSLFDPLLFGNFMDPFPLWDYNPSSLYAKDAQAAANTHVDWWESSDAHIIQADLPGVTKEDVEILVENGRVLQISGRSKKGQAFSGTCRRGERSKVGYLRRLKLPSNADAAQLKAEVENGVLTVTIPKKLGASDDLRIVEIQE
eukprot:Gb_25774 [translate_table: standard]